MSYLDLRDLADKARALSETDNPDEIEELAKLAELAVELGFPIQSPEQLSATFGYEVASHDADEIADALTGAADNDPTLIPESEFEDYARQLAEDIGAISGDEGWPLSYIDWERAAKALAMDYTSVTYDGTDYLIRL